MRLVALLLGSLVSAAVLMAWGFVFWMGLPLADAVLRPLPDGDRFAAALADSIAESGVYMHPAPPRENEGDPQADEEFLEKHAQGPLVQVIFRREGIAVTDPTVYILGFVQFFAMSLVLGVLLSMVSGSLPRYIHRIGVAVLVGVFGIVAVRLADSIWFHHPWPYFALLAAFEMGQALIAGLVMGSFVRPPNVLSTVSSQTG